MSGKYLLREYYELCAGGVCQDLLTEGEKAEVRNEFQTNLNKKKYKQLLSLNGEYFFMAINKKKPSFLKAFLMRGTPYLLQTVTI